MAAALAGEQAVEERLSVRNAVMRAPSDACDLLARAGGGVEAEI